jgi:hypothetical protein
MMVYACHSRYARSTNRRTMALVGQGINARPYLKITKAKRTSGVAQVIEHMATQYKTLSSIPSTATKKKKKEKFCVR